MMAYPLMLRIPCANTERVIDGKASPCSKPAGNVCNGCFLVQYCSRECQQEHWKLHKVDCKSALMKATWKPSWVAENRQPAFIGNDQAEGTLLFGQVRHGKKKYLWGNVPAFDILEYEHNEVNLPNKLHLLFAASGDIRNVVKSVAGIPITYRGTCEIVINDRDFDIVARNIILLLAALCLGADEAPPIMLHIWYSALVPTQVARSLQEKIAPLIRDVCAKIRDKKPNSLQAKTWKYDTRSLRLVLQKSQWDSLLTYFEIPAGLSTTEAQKLRTSTTLAPERRDYVDRALYSRSPSWRVSMMKFRKDGILLPFGASRAGIDTPNPTFYQDRDFWPMMDSAEPLEGWPLNLLIEKAPLAKSDLYGSLFLYIQELLMEFCQKVRRLDIHFHLFHLDAIDLPSILESSSKNKQYFDRIEVSNIGDRCYLGPATTLAVFGPMLKPKSQNPHATLITLFLNIVQEETTPTDYFGSMKAEVDKLEQYLPMSPDMVLGRNISNPDFIRYMEARIHFQDFDKIFDRFLRSSRLNEVGKFAGLEMKSKNTVIDPWPLRLGKSATQKEFDILLASCHLGSERYVEWKSLT